MDLNGAKAQFANDMLEAAEQVTKERKRGNDLLAKVQLHKRQNAALKQDLDTAMSDLDIARSNRALGGLPRGATLGIG